MNEIKPVYQTRDTFCSEWVEVDEERYNRRIVEAENYEGRILYPATDYEALQKENEDLQLRLDAKTLSHQLMLDRTLGLQKENDDQKRKIIGLEKELVEWNEFKKIRDAQMDALRKQMP